MSLKPPWEETRKMVVRMDEETDPSYGRPPSERSLEEHIRYGLIDLDKPSGPSSHEVVAWTKRMLGLKHAGHGGTLETFVAKNVGAIPWLRVFYHSH
jgi:H/ACA ribonucleoprotein complex subunit 4